MQPQSNPLPQLVAVAESKVAGPLVGPLASVDDTIYLVRNGPERDQMLAVNVGDLRSLDTWDLPAGVRWGPQRVGHLVLLELESGELWAWGATAKLRWKAPLPAPLAGQPLLDGDQLLLTSVNGHLWRLATSGGERLPWSAEQEMWELGEALGAGPLVLAERVLLLGMDSTVSTVELPRP